MTSPYRLPLHNLDTTGATTTKDTPRYNPATGRVEWRAAEVSALVAGPGIQIDRTDPAKPVISATDALQAENTTPTGVQVISATPPTTEAIIAGMDLTNLAVGEPAQVAVNLWISMNQPSVTKGATARLRDGGLTGTVLATQVFPDTPDSTLGHASQWVYTGEHVLATNRLVVTIQATTGAPTIYSDTRYFSATQAVGKMLDDLTDVDMSTVPPADRDVPSYDAASGTWVPAGNERIVVLPAGVTTLPPGTPPKSLILRRLP